MRIRKIVRIFKRYSVFVTGMRGRGKDMLMGNIVCRRDEPYISNTDYGGNFHPFDYAKLELGMNTYKNFITGDINFYEWPYADGTDIYLSDAQVYFPSHYCNELNKAYPQMPMLQQLFRHVAAAGFHANCQTPNRLWDKIREHYDKFLLCNWCHVFFGKIVIQKITLYDRYEAFEKRVPPFPLRKPMFNQNRIFQWKMQQANYVISHGEIQSHLLIYWNKSKYDTRLFKELLLNGKKKAVS